MGSIIGECSRVGLFTSLLQDVERAYPMHAHTD
jgi:hypothetical protein